jgi:hypothetical protein
VTQAIRAASIARLEAFGSAVEAQEKSPSPPRPAPPPSQSLPHLLDEAATGTMDSDHGRFARTDRVGKEVSQKVMAIYVFWGAVVAGLVVFIAGIVGACRASGTIVGIPAGIVAAVVGLAAAIAVGIAILRSEASSANTTLCTKLDFTEYRDGHWPSAVTN